jgi:hypothetical protein
MSTASRIDCRRLGLLLALAATALVLPSCDWDGNFTILGYTTEPNYNTKYHTVYVPIFKNLTFYRELEFQLTRAVVREIEAKTPYKVVGNRDTADTELTGTIVNFNKVLLSRNQLNEVREAQTILTVEVIWKDLHTGEPLTQPRPRGIETYPDLPPGTELVFPPTLPGTGVPAPKAPEGVYPPVPQVPVFPEPQDQGGLALPPPPGPVRPVPFLITSTATFIPELGGSVTTSQKTNVDRMAIQIVNMMEKPW